MLACVICFSILLLCSVRVCYAENAGRMCVSHWIRHADSKKWNNTTKHQHDRRTNQHETEIKSRVNMRDSSSFFACVSFSPQSSFLLADFFVAVIVVSHFSPHINVAAAIAFIYILPLSSAQFTSTTVPIYALHRIFFVFRIGCEVFVCFVNKLLMWNKAIDDLYFVQRSPVATIIIEIRRKDIFFSFFWMPFFLNIKKVFQTNIQQYFEQHSSSHPQNVSFLIHTHF